MHSLSQALQAYLKLLLGRGVFKSYGQNGEDAIAHALLRSVRNGFYVDVGAYHPTLYSNTFAFYERGWRGIVIDPNEAMRPLFRAVRPRDEFVHAGISRAAGMKTYYVFSDGAYNTFDLNEATERKTLSYPRFLGEKQVRTLPLSEVLHEYGVTKVDFLNVDVEGLDREVLESYDWSIPPSVVAVESRTFNPDMPSEDLVYQFMREKGYALQGLAAYTLIFAR